jgi:competence ComEA-like helix-hairpin-helix protein
MFCTNDKGQGKDRILKYPLIFGAVALLSVGSLARGQSATDAPSLPEGRGKAEFERICSQCHGVESATSLRMTGGAWSGVVDDMVSRGAQGTQDEFDLVTRYLTAHFGPDNPAGDAKPSTAKVNLNKASEKDLSTVLGLSAADAQAIVHYREAAGDFADWNDLQKVPHIDLKKLAAEKDRIEFSKAQ